MVDPAKIREIAERNAEFLALKPARGHLTGVTKARWVDGLRSEVEEGPWKVAVDMPLKAGGDETAPTPGMLGRGALASCLVTGISMWAARLGVPIDALEVEVQGDFDARGELGVGDNIPPGYQEIRYLISIDSPASATARWIARHASACSVTSPILPHRVYRDSPTPTMCARDRLMASSAVLLPVGDQHFHRHAHCGLQVFVEDFVEKSATGVVTEKDDPTLFSASLEVR